MYSIIEIIKKIEDPYNKLRYFQSIKIAQAGIAVGVVNT
jgi:hypothetical protein